MQQTEAPPAAALFECRLSRIEATYRGKVRDLFALDGERLLIVASDRLSAFDVILPTPVPGKGELLTRVSNFWFERFAARVPNHLLPDALADLPLSESERRLLEGRAVIVRRLRALPIEAIVRGYLIGSGWKDYRRDGRVSGLRLPAGLRLAEQLPEPLFTPSTKAAAGSHDESIDFAAVVGLVGEAVAARVREISLAIYREAAGFALERGIIIADTKFEFGLDERGEVVLMDELLTPDSSRFWPADAWRAGENPPSFDKQFVRDYLETLAWDKRAPGPPLPPAIVEQTAAKYREAVQRLTGPPGGH